MTLTPIRMALAGLGVRGTQWAEVIAASPRAELVAVIDPDPSVSERAAAPAYSGLAEALDVAKPDAVVLATPPESHLEAVHELAARGVPILCEKPLAEHIEEAATMVRTAERAGVPLLVGMNFRYFGSTVRIRELLASGALGVPMYAVFTYLRNRGRRPDLNTYPLTMDDPMLLEQSIHHLDLLRYAYDREVETVVAESWNPPTSVYRGDSSVAVLLRMTGGLRVSYVGTWTAGTNRFEFSWRTDCADGILVQAAQEGELSVARRVPGAEISGPRFPTDSEPLVPENLTPDRFLIDDTVRLLDHYVDVIEGLAEPGPTGRDHLRTLGLLDSIVVSARTGTRIDVEAHLDTLGLLE